MSAIDDDGIIFTTGFSFRLQRDLRIFPDKRKPAGIDVFHLLTGRSGIPVVRDIDTFKGATGVAFQYERGGITPVESYFENSPWPQLIKQEHVVKPLFEIGS